MPRSATRDDRPAYLKVRDVATRLNVSQRHVYDLIASRELETFRFGDANSRLGLRITRESLDDFEKRRRVPAVG
jgi:excisionase family DNA binding protein